MTFDPDGRFHQPNAALGEYRDSLERAYAAPRTGIPVGYYSAGVATYDRPSLATGFSLYAPAERLLILHLFVDIVTSWTAAGAARVSIGTADYPDALVAPRNLVGVTGSFQGGGGVISIQPDTPLVVTVDGSPTAGALAVRFIAAASGAIVPATYDPDTQSYAQ